ncbi:MAG: CinA family nicotinamide mononucleotide deamidase-related protein, partial [Phycisphaerales bacterium JB059]
VDSGMESPHRTGAILAIGDELILGQKTDTNTAWIADQLTARSVRVVEHVTVDDDEGLIAETMRRLGRRVDLLVCTGGLGPTADDLTRQGLAGAMGDELVEDERSLAQIEAWFRGRGRDLPAANRVQALRPSRGRSLPNPHGTAPGLAGRVEVDGHGCDTFCLPGPPREMRPMFEAEVVPALRVEPGRLVRTRMLHTFGLGESEVARRLGGLMDRDRTPLVGTTASGGVVTCRIRFEGEAGEDEAAGRLDESEAQVRARLGEVVFARDTPAAEALERAVVQRLSERSETLVVAESCTGGMLGERVTRVAGSSAVFLGGWLTYSNAMPRAMLGVGEEELAQQGAVSRAVALSMARGALQAGEGAGGADHALAITGVAGPGGGSEEKPVGTVWIARASRDGTADARLFRFGGDRAAVRGWSAVTALGMLRLHLDRVETPLLGQIEPAQED